MQNKISIIVNHIFEPITGCPGSRVCSGLAFVQADELIKHFTADYNSSNIRTTNSTRKDKAVIIAGIRRTLKETPREFYIINDGITITVDKLEVAVNEDGQKVVTLYNPTITNGGLTREELEIYVLECWARGVEVLASVSLRIHIGTSFFCEHMGVANVGSNTHSTIAPELVANGMGWNQVLKEKMGSELEPKIDWKNPTNLNIIHKTLMWVLPGHTFSPVAIYNSQPTKTRDNLEKSLEIYQSYHESDLQLILKMVDSMLGSIPEIKQHFDESCGHTYEWVFSSHKHSVNIPWSLSGNPSIKITKAEYALLLTCIKQMLTINPDTKRIVFRIRPEDICAWWLENGGELMSRLEELYVDSKQSLQNFAQNPEAYKRATVVAERFIKRYEDARKSKSDECSPDAVLV